MPLPPEPKIHAPGMRIRAEFRPQASQFLLNSRRRLDVLAGMRAGGYRRPFADRRRGLVLGRPCPRSGRLLGVFDRRPSSSSRPAGGALQYPVDCRQAEQCIPREPNAIAHAAEIDTGNRRSRQVDALPEIAGGRIRIAKPLGRPTEVVKRQIVLISDILDEGSEIGPSCGAIELRRPRLGRSPRRDAGVPARQKRLAGLQFGDCLRRAESGPVSGATCDRPTAGGDQRDARHSVHGKSHAGRFGLPRQRQPIASKPARQANWIDRGANAAVSIGLYRQVRGEAS